MDIITKKIIVYVVGSIATLALDLVASKAIIDGAFTWIDQIVKNIDLKEEMKLKQ